MIYDCAVIGAGLGGSITAMSLARQGAKVVVVEAGSHPRFAIGESLIPTTSYGLRALARAYDIPEIADVTHYLGQRQIGGASYPKNGFWFGLNQEKEPLRWPEQLLFLSPGLPLGPDVHMLRSDTDAFLAASLPKYGVAYRDRSPVQRIDFDAESVSLGIEGGEPVTARYLIDASGPRSPLARQLGLRANDPRMHTRSRAIFSHFVDVPPLETVLETAPVMVTNRDSCTIHQCFDGGWFWFIRFDNGVVSVGLMLDINRPLPGHDNSLSPEQEFWSVVRRFPTIDAALRGARAILPFRATPRLQYRNTRCFGERFAVLPHATAFTDPLFSNGLSLTQAFVRRLVPRLTTALDSDQLGPEPFADIGDLLMREVDAVDQLIATIYASFRGFELFKQSWRLWTYLSILQYLCQAAERDIPEAPFLGLYGANIPRAQELLTKVHREVSSSDDPRAIAERLHQMWSTVEEPFAKHSAHWELDASTPCVPDQSKGVAIDPWFTELCAQTPALADKLALNLLEHRNRRLEARAEELQRQAAESRASGGRFHVDLAFLEDTRRYAEHHARDNEGS